MDVDYDFLRELEDGGMPAPCVRKSAGYEFPEECTDGNGGEPFPDSSPDDEQEQESGREVVKALVRSTDPVKDFFVNDGCVSLSALSSMLGFRSVDALIDALVKRKVVSRCKGYVRIRKKFRSPSCIGVRSYTLLDANGNEQSFDYLVFTEEGVGMVREVLGIRESVQMELF